MTIPLSDLRQIVDMAQYSIDYSDMPDGAFFALAEEMFGWDYEVWAWYAENTPEDMSPEEIIQWVKKKQVKRNTKK